MTRKPPWVEPVTSVAPQVLTLGTFELRPAERVLLLGNTPVVLGTRAFDVLLALVDSRERLVSKNELLDRAWPGVVVEENNLTVQISALRKVLGPAAITTITGRGYRLALPVIAAVADARPTPVPKPDLSAGPAGIDRQVLALVVGEVVGWPRLVARDATAAALAWRQTRSQHIENTLREQGGRLVELTPERLLAAFTSAVRAVDWALQLQQNLHEQRAAGSVALRMRIGVTVDDVIIDEGKLVGDGVNVALRLQQLAGHDEVLVTQPVRDFTAHKLEAVFEPLGERLLPASNVRLSVFRASRSAERNTRVAPPAAADRLAALAVLPLASEGSAEDAYLGDGLTEQIIASLSVDRALFVIAHNSTLRYRDRATDLATVAEELGVRYLLTGTVRRAGKRLRIQVALVLAEHSQVIWQERYDGTDDDLFDFQSRIATGIAAAVNRPLLAAEIDRVRHRPTDSFGAYDCVLRALPGMYQFETPAFDDCGQWLQRAVGIDSDYAQAHAHLAWWYSLCAGEGRAPIHGEQRSLALDHALRAATLDPRDAFCLSVAGHLLTLLKKDFARATDMFDQALTINPGSAWAWARSGACMAYQGHTDEALERVRRAVQLSPVDTNLFAFHISSGIACMTGGRYGEAVAWLGKSLRLNPKFNAARRLQVAALVQVGEFAEAAALAEELLAAQPDFSVADFGAWYPMQEPYLTPLLKAMRRGGLPA